MGPTFFKCFLFGKIEYLMRESLMGEHNETDGNNIALLVLV